MTNTWIAAAALVSAMSLAWVVLFDQGVPAPVVVSTIGAGLAGFGIAARWGRHRRV